MVFVIHNALSAQPNAGPSALTFLDSFMNHTNQKARSFAPSSDAASTAASAFIEKSNQWGERYASAQTDLSTFLRAKVSAPARGFLATDPLNMSVFGVVFDGNPGAGFVAVPGAVADRLQERGLRGNAYFPDVGTAMGKEVMAKLNAVSRAAEQRPLLNSVAGVSSVAIEDGRVVLSRAILTDDGISIIAAPSAVSAAAEVKPRIVAELATVESAEPASRPAQRNRM